MHATITRLGLYAIESHCLLLNFVIPILRQLGHVKKKIVPPKNFILGQKFSAIVLKIFENFCPPGKILSA